jgi:prevent-host-death family protein
MKMLSVGKLKANFSEVLREVDQGKPVAIEYGRKHTPVAVIMPFEQYTAQEHHRKLGVLENKGAYTIHDDFAIDDEELLEK